MSDNKIKSIFIALPQWLPYNPPFSLVPIVSLLREKGYQTKILDLNIEYYLDVLNKNYLKKTFIEAEKQLPVLFEFLSRHFQKGKSEAGYDENFKAKLLRYNKIKSFTGDKKDKVLKSIENIEHSIKVMRDKELFYKPIELTKAMACIDFCLEIASLPYFPAQIQTGTYTDTFFKLDFETILKSAENKNMFTAFLKDRLPGILSSNPYAAGLSINSSTQVLPALTLALMLKKKTKVKVIIGGNYFSRVTESIEKHPEFFKYFCDYLMINEGEIANLKLLQYLEGSIALEEVPNILYLKDGAVKTAPVCAPLPLNEHPVSDLSDFDLKKYLTPEIVIPQYSSRGCYWGKCSFCDHDFGQKINVKSVSKFVDELETINKKYGIKHFEFIDECISPAYLKKLSDEILSRHLDIAWFNNARLEEAFTQEVLSSAHKAGLKMLLWGFESGSKRIMELINKGIDTKKREEILRRSRKIGIWNFAFIFFGFPSETKEDAQQTIDYIKNHTDIISSYGRSIFTMGKHAPLRNDPEKYSITKTYPDKEEFSPSWHFETSSGMTKKEISEAADKCLIECNEAYKNPLWMYLIQREILFLYICRYGADGVSSMQFK